MSDPSRSSEEGVARRRACRLASAGVLLAAVAVAVASARPYAESSNDGSRLAAAEAVVDHHSLAIDASVFVDVPPPGSPPERRPYTDDVLRLLPRGTEDKIKVGDHFYSDKPYTLSLYLAGCYKILQAATGLKARERPGPFCWWLTLLSSGLAYVAAVWCVWRLAGALGLGLVRGRVLAAGFGRCCLARPD